jgi:predicted N-formylglutamate amidohydrolase
MARIDEIVLSCEHGGNRVPKRYAHLFAGRRDVLESHRGHDPGTATLARQLQRAFQCPLIVHSVTRLLVEVNRSPWHRSVFSEFSRSLSNDEKSHVLKEFYYPHRLSVEGIVRDCISRNRTVLHLSVHSFTPVLDGVVRKCDVGLLYDPKRSLEIAFCRRWLSALSDALPELVLRRNSPYRGSADGLTTFLRNRFSATRYLGIELEVNQSRVAGRDWPALRRALTDSLRVAVEGSWRRREGRRGSGLPTTQHR